MGWGTRQRVFAPLLAVLFGCAGVTHGAIMTIDNFSQPDPAHFFVLGSGMNPSMHFTESSIGALGGQRDVLVDVIGQGTPTSIVGLVGQDTHYHLDAMQVGTNGLAPSVLTLEYNGVNLTIPEGLNPLAAVTGTDLTLGGNDRFWIHFLSCDAQPTSGLDVNVIITSPGGLMSSVLRTAPNALGAYDFYIPFSGLSGTASIHNVETIKFVFNGNRKTPNVDYEIQLLATVPEPGSVTLLAIALGVMGWAAHRVRRRRHRT